MHYVQYAVSPRLAPWVEGVWRLTGAAAADSPAHRVFPDGCPEIVIHLGDRFRERADEGRARVQPDRLIVGQMVRPVTLEPLGVVDVWGIRLHPWGARLVFDGPASALTGRIEQAGDIAPDLTRALERALCDAGASTREQLDALGRVLMARAADVALPDPLTAHAARRLLRAPGATAIARLADEAGISARQLERRFLATVGLTPKTFARIARFQQVCGVLDAAPETLAAAAVRCGYYDQSHLARDVKDFAGSTPAALRDTRSAMTEHFLRARR